MPEAHEDPNPTRTTLSMIRQFHLDGKYWDVQLQIDAEVFKCQRSLLAANCVYFDTMFSSSNFEESDARANQPIILHKIDAQAFKELLRFIYTGKICVNDSNVLQLLFMGDFLQLRTGHVKMACLIHVKKRSQEIAPMSNALELLYFACLKEENVLCVTLRAHICRHLYYYSKDARLMDISFESLNALLEFSKDYIAPLRGSADVLLMIVHKWINHNREGRSQYHSNLMKNINFENVSSNFSRLLMNRLQNALNEVIILSKDIGSLSESKMLAMVTETNLPAGEDQLDAINFISFNVKNVRSIPLSPTITYSPSCIIHGLLWKIAIVRKSNQQLGLYLHCDGKEVKTAWYCYATVIFTVKSHKDGRKDYVAKMGCALFSSVGNRCESGPAEFWKWDGIYDPENGYINDDGSVNLNARVYVDVPFLL